MRNGIHILMILIAVLSSCSRQNNAEPTVEADVHVQTEIPQAQAPTTHELNRTMFVNATSGLRVRNAPNIDADRIGVLDDLTEVLAVEEYGSTVLIDGIEGRWTLVRADGIQGWVFGGYLSLDRPLRIAESTTKASMDDIIDFFTDYFNLDKLWPADSIEDLMSTFGDLGENKRVITRTYDAGIYGGVTIDETVIEDGPYRLMVWGVSLMGLSIEINESRFINLFPYRTLEEYLADGNFGNDIWEWEEEGNSFTSLARSPDYEEWFLEFKNGILHRFVFSVYVS